MKLISGLLEHRKFSALYASPLKRAKGAARILGSKLLLKSRMDKRLMEIDFGAWEGRTSKDLMAKDRTFQKWVQGKGFRPSGGESLHALRARVRKFLQDCLGRHEDKNIVIVSHGGVIRMMILDALRLPIEYFFSFQVEPASISELEIFSRKQARLSYLNVRWPQEIL